MIQWKDEYLIGVAPIDHQHKVIVELTNELLTLAEGERELVDMATGFDHLAGMLSIHLAIEDEVIRHFRPDGWKGHLAAHSSMRAILQATHDEFLLQPLQGIDALTGFIRNWLIGHIAHSDVELAAALNADALEEWWARRFALSGADA